MKILFVDSSPLYRDILLRGLQSHGGFEMIYAASAAEALESAARQPINFYILAGQLPDRDGIILARELRQVHATAHEPIVLLTGSPSAELAQMAARAGVTELFRKQDVEELVAFMQFFLRMFQPMPCRVLYVEDANDQRMLLAGQMQEWGMTVDAFATAEEAWLALQANRYDLVLCDVVLGTGMSGSRLINRIRRQTGQLGQLPILAATAFDNPARRIELFHFGIDDYIVKPIVPLELKARVNHLLERNRAIEQSRQAVRAKGEFLANMSHEIRTPMHAIMGMITLARRRTVDAQVCEQLDKAKGAADLLLSIINDILDYSKIEAGRLVLERATFRLGELMENLASLIGHKTREKGLVMQIDLPEGLAGLPLRGDSLRLSQILINLAGNAVKFTHAGTIAIRVRLVEETAGDCLLHFDVEDTGIGIAPEDQKRLFAAFEQADGSMSRKYGGTGLGLAICKQLVVLMGGEIDVESVPGDGSRFWFTVRLGKAAQDAGITVRVPQRASRTAEERLKARYAGARVLLVEDEPINQEVSRGLLEDAGLTVDLAADGEQAVTMASTGNYDLILMDMQMPRMNGVDATRVIRGLPDCPQPPIIAMTANAFEQDRQACLAAGMSDHVSKPVHPEVLFETLLRWLS